MSVITVNNVSFKYPQSDKAALFDVSFGIEKGSYLAIVGYNGCGKSTLARLLCGLEMPSSGTIHVEENNRIGIVFQSPKNQLVSGIVSRDTAFGPQNLGLNPGEVELRVIESLNVVDMLDRASSSTGALSLGQTQRVALSGVLALRPEILILDEAVSMLDPQTRHDILEFIRYWHKCGNTIIQITHDIDVVEDADTVLAIDEGRVVFYGTKNAYLNNEGASCLNDMISIRRSASAQASCANEVTLKLEDVSYYHDTAHGIHDVSLTFQAGTLTALTGPSGAGKSTLLEVCAGLSAPASGTILCRSERTAVRRPVLAQQNAQAALFEPFAADDVAFGARNCGVSGKELVTAVKRAMDEAALPFEQFGERRTFELSGGEQRRLSIAGILVLDADVIMFDEPTAGLDSRARKEVMELLRRLASQGKTIIFSTHRRDEAEFADREIVIENGEVVKDMVSIQCSEPAQPSSTELSEMPPSSSASLISTLKSVSAGLSRATRHKVSLIEKLPPVIRILLFTALFVFSLAVRPLWLCFAALAVAVLYCVLAGFSLRRLVCASLKILPFLLLFSIFQMIFHPAVQGEVHFTEWKWFMVTPSKLIFCLATIIRTIASLGCISAFFVSTPEYDLMDGLNILLTPLRLCHVPVRYLILIIEIIFRFIPLLVDEAVSIIKTQVIRGGLVEVKGKLSKIRAILPLIVPLIIQTIKRSEALADAITMRCFK